MSDNAPTYILGAEHGETLKLGPPISGELRIKLNPGASGSQLAMGTLTLGPGGRTMMSRFLRHDSILFVHKGQGRAVLSGHSATVVPGSVVAIPRGTWHAVRNTGTGFLQLAWASAPGGLEEYFREMSRLPAPADPARLAEIYARYGVEFQQDGAEPASQPSGGGRRHRPRRRGGRSAARAGAPATGSAQPAPPPQLAAAPQPPAATAQTPSVQRPVPPVGSGRPRRRRGRRGGRGGGTGVPPSSGPSPRASRPTPAPAPASETAPPSGPVKEVYMNGRWVRVTGEGPVIAPGRDRGGFHRGRPRRGVPPRSGGRPQSGRSPA